MSGANQALAAPPAEPATPGQRLFAKQLERAMAGPQPDIAVLFELVAAAYDDADRDRKRTDRSIALMVEELDELNAGLEQTIAERTQALVKAEARYRDLIENAMVGVYRSSPTGEILFANPAMARINGYDDEARFLASSPRLALEWYLEPSRRAEFVTAIERDGRVVDFVSEVRRHGTGERIWISETAWIVRDEAGVPLCYEGTVIEATDRILAEKRMEHMALHDSLTGLANREGFRRALERLWQSPDAGELALVCIDLDRFKEANDTLGHKAGDRILTIVADRLREAMRPGDVAARLGGDEFALLAPDHGGSARLQRYAERLIEALSKQIMIDGQTVNIGASAGIASRDAETGNPEMLLQNADIAMYRAKLAGRGRALAYLPAMGEAVRQRVLLENDLRQAIARNELTLNYQPVVEAKTGRIAACEALLRWRRNGQLISPVEFIPIAEESGLMIPIGEWVIREACLEAARWPVEIGIAVNLSPTQFRSPKLLPSVVQALAMSGLAPQRLELEITETVMMMDDRATSQTLRGLRDLGVRIALDDFGIGHSSLSYLHRFRFDKIKIDRSFVASFASDPVNNAIVRAVIRLGDELGISIVAEGVETDEQLAALRREHCGLFQGYLFGRPSAPDVLGFPRLENQHAAAQEPDMLHARQAHPALEEAGLSVRRAAARR